MKILPDEIHARKVHIGIMEPKVNKSEQQDALTRPLFPLTPADIRALRAAGDQLICEKRCPPVMQSKSDLVPQHSSSSML